MDIENIKLEGDAKDIAEQIFQKIVSQVYEEIKAKDPVKAGEFAFCMAGNSIGCLLSVTNPEKVHDVKGWLVQCADHMAIQTIAMKSKKTKFS